MALLVPLLWGTALPAVVTAIVLTVVRFAAPNSNGRLAQALALGLGYAAGHVVIALPAWPPIEVTDRVPFLVLAALVLGVLDSVWPAPAWAVLENRVLLACLTVVVLLGPAVQESWGTRATTLWLAGLALVMIVVWNGLDALASRAGGAAVLLPLVVVGGGAAVVMVISGSLISGRLAGALAAALAGAAVAAAWGPSVSMGRGGVAVVVVALASLLLLGNVYSETPATSASLLAVAPLAPCLVRIGPLGRLTGGKAALAATAAALVPVGAAVGFALAAMPASEY